MLYWDPVFPQSSHEAAASPPTEEETGLAQHEGLPKPPWSKWEPRALHPNPPVTVERLRASREDKNRLGNSRG